MKRFMSVLLAFVLVFSLTAPAAAADQVQKATLTADKQKVYKGEDVTVTLSMDKTITNMTAWQFNIYFEGDKFAMKSSSVAAGAYKTTTVGNAGDRGNQGMYVPVSALDVQGLPVQLLAGDVCSITFTAKKDAEVGDADFRVVCIDLYDYDDITTNMKGQCGIENVTVTVAEKPAETSAYKVVRDSEQDEPLTADIGDTVEVRFNVQGLAKNETTWNGASAKFTYDASALEFVEANHVFGDNATVDSSKAGVVTVQGFTEESRTSDAAPLAILTFRAKGNAVSKVEVAEAKIWNEAQVPDDTVPAVTEVESATVVSGEVNYDIKVTGDGAADVTLPVQQVKAGGAFYFQITEDGTSRYDITVTVGGEAVTPIKTSGRYVVRGVTGEVVINVTKAYRVNVEGNAAEDVAPSADYFYGDEENIITVSKQDGYDYTIVIKSGDTVLNIKDNDGEFVIPAGSIKGTVTVTANKTKQVTYTVSAMPATQEVEAGKEFSIMPIASSSDTGVNCTSVEMDVNYDTAKAELVQAAVNSGTYTTGTGVVHIQADNLSAAMIKVGRIQFKALAAGTTKITLTNVKVNGAAATTADATVTITAAPTPDPVYTLTMSPETQTAQVGDSVKVSVALTAENAETYGVLGMQMTYDADKLEYVGATTTSANVQGRANAGTLTVKCAGESRAIAGTVVTLEFKALAAGDSKLTITNSTVDGAAAAAANTASVSVTEPETKTVYTASLTTDTTAANYDEEIRVLVKPGSENDQNATFDGSALQIRYDSSKLEYDYLDTPYHESDVDIRVDEENGVITVSGFGGRDLPVAKVPYVAAVTFKAKAAGTGTVTLDSAALTAEHALPGTEDAAKILNGSVSVEITVPDYTVTKPDYVLGAAQATAGADYTFTLANPDLYNYSGVLVYVNDMLTDVNHNADGSYTVPGNCVTGNMKIVVTQLVKSFTVAVTGSGAADVTAAGKAAYGKDFTFTVRKAAGCTYTITAKIGENAIPVAEDNGSCTISGSDITGNVTITVTKQEETPVTTAYGIYVDPKTQDAMVNENVELKVKVSSEDSATFNAYTAKIAYDATRLTLKNVECPDSEENTSWKDEDGVVTLLGFGNNKPVDKAYVAILSFTTKAPGTAEVTILEAAVDHKNNAPDKDTPAATVTGNGVINITGTYKVTLDAGLTADESVATTGKDYIFKATDSNHYDYAPVATINGSQITVIDNHDGTYTIPGAQIVGEIDVKANRTPKTYEVTVTGTGAGDVKAEKNAVYNTNYTFTVTKDGSYTYTVTAKIGNQAVALSEGGNGSYTITGTAITGDITITVEKTLKPVTAYPVEKPDYVTGADTAEKGKDYNFTVTTEPGYSYGEPEVTVGGEKVEITKNDDGSYTIPGDKITGKIVIRVERTKALDVEVSHYLQLNGKTMWLVTTTAKLEDGQTALYDGQAMFHSEAYGAYAWLVISDKGLEDVKAEAAKLVTAGTGKAVEIDYNGDVNMTGKVDVNDAQLVYDMYQAAYEDFTTVSMEKFLRADTNLSKTVDTSDTAKLIADMTRN